MRSCRLLQCCETPAEERSAVNPHATFCGNWRRATASSDPVGEEKSSSLPRPLRSPRPSRATLNFDCWKQNDFFAINHHQKAENIRRSESAIGVIVDPH